MVINIKLIGLFRIKRFKQKGIDYPAGTKVQDVFDDLQLPQQHFGFVLINGVHAQRDTVLSEGDHLVILPLLGGG